MSKPEKIVPGTLWACGLYVRGPWFCMRKEGRSPGLVPEEAASMMSVGSDLLSVCARKQIFSVLGCHSSQKLLSRWTESAVSGRESLGGFWRQRSALDHPPGEASSRGTSRLEVFSKSHHHTSAPEGGRGSRLVRLGTEGFESKDLGLEAQAFPWQWLQGPLVFPVGCPGLQDRQEVRPPSWRC